MQKLQSPFLLLSVAALSASLVTSLSGCGQASFGDNLAKSFTHTELTEWAPSGERLASAEEQTNPIIPQGDHFITIHGGVRSNDEVNIALAPVFEQTWNTETNAMVTESPVFGADGSSYFIPASPTDGGENLLIKVSPDGEREFAVTRTQLGDVVVPVTGEVLAATKGQGASPIILNDPDINREVAYAASYSRAYAVDEHGQLLWNVETQPAALEAAINTGDSELIAAELEKPHRIFGINYHPAVDAILVADISGDVIAFDRQTGARLGAIVMPGSPATGGDNALGGGGGLSDSQMDSITSLIGDLAQQTFADSGIELQVDSGGAAAIQAVLGSGAVIGNQISVDPDTNSLWVASTDLDAADGTLDGLSEMGALFRIDLTREGNQVNFEFVCHESFDGGTTSTPAVSADGLRVYTTDNFGAAIAITRDCERAWTLDVGEAAVASLAVSSERSTEIYYPTLTSIYKIQENESRSSAEVVWAADLNAGFVGGERMSVVDQVSQSVVNALESRLGFELPGSIVSVGASNLDLASIGQNGIMIHSGYGPRINLGGSSYLLPIALNNGLYDRSTGEFINGTRALEENIGAMYVAPDGTIIMGSSPVRRAVLRALVKTPDFLLPEFPPLLEQFADGLVDYLVRPLAGGITKYGVTQGFDLLARDAACQGQKRINNTLSYKDNVDSTVGVDADTRDVIRLAEQALQAVSDARSEGELGLIESQSISAELDAAIDALESGSLADANTDLTAACDALKD